MDFYQICVREIEQGPKKGTFELYPDFIIGKSKDLMVMGRSFYAIWDEEVGLWSTNEYDVQRLVDADLKEYADAYEKKTGVKPAVRYLRSASSNGWYQFRKFIQNISDSRHQLDENLTFANTDVKKSDYVSKRLPYALTPGNFDAWDELVGTLYSTDERAKIEWGIGALVSGDSKKIQKFFVLYGPPGKGKGTIINVMIKLFPGYYAAIDAKALGSSSSAFATEVFKDNPLWAFQQDGDLSRIEDNARLNSVISHEDMNMNEKYKPGYTSKVNAMIWLGTNKPVKISDAKSGIIRRLIDVTPTGVTIPENHYHTLMGQTDFELGAIAFHCLEVYRSMGKNYYSGYRPLEMMFQTDVFFNFIEAHYDTFKEQDSTTVRQAYVMYKEFCSDTGIDKPLPQHKFREELRNYFDDFKDRGTINGSIVRGYYSGFNANKFKTRGKGEEAYSLVMDETVSLLDERYATMPAQLARTLENGQEIPAKRWANNKTILSDIDTNELHFVKIPPQDIVIDFDLTDETGGKSLERNLEAASVWPTTYAELSKSGHGVHLHYEFDGDVSELSENFSNGIEVKTLLGDASLRRRLSKCNNVPVAAFTGSLPVKEKKVLDEKVIKSEIGLRNLITRNLNKEIKPGTKPSIDFIKHILDEAYESGMQYDLMDMRGKIMTFATKSTNQAMTCLQIVSKMKFKSDHVDGAGQTDDPMFGEDPIPPGEMRQSPNERVERELFDRRDNPLVKKDERPVFYDVEVYRNLFVVCWKYAGPDASIVRMVNPSAKDIEGLLGLKLVGFNNRRYDNHILYAALQGYTNEMLYNLSQKIINNNHSALFGEAYNLSYTDIYEFAAKKQGLKKWELELGLPHVEMDLPWDEPVDPALWERVTDYCCNDVMATEAVFNHLAQDFIARQILAELSGLSVNDTTNKHSARIIFGTDRNPQQKFKYTHLKEMFPGYEFDAGKSTYQGEVVGEGGYVYAEPGMYEDVALLDVASMHPTSIEQLNLFGDYTPRFSELKNVRLAIKNKDYEGARQMLDGRLVPHLSGDGTGAKALSDALKIVINSVYGLTSAKFDNPFRDMRNRDNIVAKRGALFMIDLKKFVQDRGFIVAHIKTDSIKIPNATPEIIRDVTLFGEKYGYTFEHEATYRRFCLVNDAVYIAQKYDVAGNAGVWEAVGAQFQHPYVFKTLFTGELVEFNDLREAKSVQKGAMYLDYEGVTKAAVLDTGKMKFVGRSGAFVPVTEDSGGALLYRVVDGKPFAVAGTTGHFWMDAELALSLGDKVEIDMSYFENLAQKAQKSIEKWTAEKGMTFQDFVS